MLKSGNPRHLSHLHPNLPSFTRQRRKSLDPSQGAMGNPQFRGDLPQPPQIAPIHSPQSPVSLPKLAAISRLDRFDRQSSPATEGTPTASQPLAPPPSRFSDSGIHLLGSRSPRDRQVVRLPVENRVQPGSLPDRQLAPPSRPLPPRAKKRKSASPRPLPLQPQRKSPFPRDIEAGRRPGHPSKPKSILSPIAYLTRMLICGVGLSAIAGTLLALWNPATRTPVENHSQPHRVADRAEVSAKSVNLPMNRELTDLKAEVEKMSAQTPGLNPGILFVDLETGGYLSLNDTHVFSAASTIKVPILVAFFQAIDNGTIRLDEELTLKPEQIVPEAGFMQYDPPGTRYTALEVATAAIVASDNTATNMLIDRLGGTETLNQKFRSWGLTQTSLHNALPDLGGTNTTSPQDLAKLILAVDRGKVISLPSRDRLLDIMKETENDSLLPQGLGEGASIAHKTGTINSILADAGLVALPTGKRYIAVVMVERTDGDDRAGDLIRQISTVAYQHFESPDFVPTTASVMSGGRE